MHALEIKQLRKVYGNGVEALKGIDLKVKQGDFFALLGANGAGKSTTIGVISTLLTKTSGTIKVNGFDLDEQQEQAKTSLGLVPQEINLSVFDTCKRILLYQAGYYGIPRKLAAPKVNALLKQLGLWEKRNTIVRSLSGGMKRRLMIARALVHAPKLLILDEPTAGVDVEIRQSLWVLLKQLNEQGTTIILTTHYLEEAEQLCKNIAIIHQGNIIKNTSMRDLLATLHHQTFVFTTQEPINNHTINTLGGVVVDDHNFELRLEHDESLNGVFESFSQNNILISSMRNKTNRLEELFMDLIRHVD